MRIFTKGVVFTCTNCGVSGEADLPDDFEGIRCNGEVIFSIICPICHRKIEVNNQMIPDHLKKHISITNRGNAIMQNHD